MSYFVSLRHNKQESETISSRASETQHQLQQEKENLISQLQDGRVERDQLMEQLRAAYREKELLGQNLDAVQKHEKEYKKERLNI